jgi:hypothetical protein
MTMHDMTHPDDERLAALASGDPDAGGDGSLRAHVAECARCASLVSDLATLRSALAELPDLAPPRPLQLVPPVPAPAPRPRPWFRRLVAPAFALGSVMVLVGAVGLAGGGLSSGGLAASPGDLGASRQDDAQRTTERSIWEALFGGAAADANATERAAGEDTSGENGPGVPVFTDATPPAEPVASPSAAPRPADDGAAAADGGWPGWPALPFMLVGGGLLLLVGGLTLRSLAFPRAG